MLVYVAGPYRAKTQWKKEHNIFRARMVAAELLARGYTPICPHTMYANMDGLCDDEVFLKADIELLRKCEAVVLVQFWEDSKGTLNEIEVAEEMGIPVYMGVDHLRTGTTPSKPYVGPIPS